MVSCFEHCWATGQDPNNSDALGVKSAVPKLWWILESPSLFKNTDAGIHP